MDSNYSKTTCTQCSQPVEFPKASAGETIACPHCGAEMKLIVRPGLTKTAWFLIGVWIVMVFGGMAAMVIFAPWKNKPANASSSQGASTNATNPGPQYKSIEGFRVSPIEIHKSEGGGLMYAVGLVENVKAEQRFGVTVELALLDAEMKQIGSASDYAGVIEPTNVWHFKALITDPKVASAKLSTIKEDK